MATPADELFVDLGRSRYRIVRPDGTPLSRVMRLNADGYDVGAGFAGGFVVTAWIPDGDDPLNEGRYEILHIDLRGRARETHHSAETHPLEPGDVTFRTTVSESDATLAYRPSTRTTFTFPTPVKNRLWERDERGWLWSCPNGGGSRGVVWWSKDGAKTWHTTGYQFRSARGPSRLWTVDCRVSGGQMFMIGYYRDLPTAFATGPFRGQARLPMSLIPLDERLNPYAADVLPDGRLVFGTDRAGLQVADSRGGRTFTFEPGPIRSGTQTWGRTSTALVWCQGQYIYLSGDGRTWTRVDPT